MKSLSFTHPETTTITSTGVSLHKLVDQLMSSFLPLAVNQHSFIVNDVAENFELYANEQVLAYVVGRLLNDAVSSSHSACIRIEAVKKAEGVQIRVRHNGSSFYTTVSHGFSDVIAAARSLGGNINIYNQRNEGTTITLSMAA